MDDNTLFDNKKYENLLDDLNQMIKSKGAGYNVAQQLNDEFWENLGTHRDRMQEQIGRLKANQTTKAYNQELAQAETIYEASRKYINKFK